MEVYAPHTRLCSSIRSNLESVILGKEREIELVLIALLAGGHLLLEDVPGTGKTQLVKALARSIGGDFRRIQCNPDLLPTDITGLTIYHPREEQFIFRPGPIMSHLVLADEINRATTKTQSALLEAMEENSVTVDGETHALPAPFILIATQNPIEFEGTYLLPEAQMDRFMMKLSLGYPGEADEKRMVLGRQSGHPADALERVASIADIIALQQQAERIHADEAVADYLVRIVRGTREHEGVQLGASPRAAVALMRAAKARALVEQREYVIPDDVKQLSPHVLSHRLLLQPSARLRGTRPETVVQDVIERTKAPVRLER
ncbi:MoxR-like ATPase [Paenibacillus pasadenensis]|uniref:MoxR-like ATPase n=1 Tax=Paenibacillus pasadenensis TaxID=217090 RepID=A0A2N5N8I6_9BACL|nr:MoxR family ATPase [Paenibacillus pasadenensis]PLT46666.1 MoxR-like ATPase [Paenibacillus pasadenensis]